MIKNKLKIIIIALCLSPFVLQASASKLFVYTDKATDVTYTTATLHGGGGDSIANPTLPMTAYFRYSKEVISPIFCNDIYGTNMIATADLYIGIASSASFSQKLINLSPDTTYYYCTIISNKENIAYGGNMIVREFHTYPLETTARTNSATLITPNSVRLNGSYSSKDATTTYFEYKRATIEGTLLEWSKSSEQKHGLDDLYGNVNFNLSGLIPNTRYQFRAVAKNISGLETKTFYGSVLSFTTSFDNSGEVETTCQYPAVLNAFGYCDMPLTCSSPYTLNDSGTACIPPTTTNCLPEQFYDISGQCIDRTVCDADEIYFPLNNSCIKKTTCESGDIFDRSQNKCITPPEPGYCETHLEDPVCLPGPGWDPIEWNGRDWTWNDGSWTDGIWTGGGWVGGNWVGGTWIGGWGTWSGGVWTNGKWTGGKWTQKLTLGQTATPPNDAIVRYHEGIETVFSRQIIANTALAKIYNYQTGDDMQTFAWNLSDRFARAFGYIDRNGKEIRVSYPDVAAYQLQLIGSKLIVYEYYNDKIVDIRNLTTVFKNASGYEYYFKK